MSVGRTSNFQTAVGRQTLDSLRSKTEKALKVSPCWENRLEIAYFVQAGGSRALAKQPHRQTPNSSLFYQIKKIVVYLQECKQLVI